MNWWQRFKRSSAHTQANIVCTIVMMMATVAYAFTAWRQLRSMNGQLGEIRKSTVTAERSAYAACLGAKISRSTLIEIQRAAIDTHMATSAAVAQAMAATESERAEMELRLGDINDQEFSLGFSTNNAGKTAAVGLNMKFRLVFISKNEDPDFRYPPRQTVTGYSGRIEPGPVVARGGGNPRMVILDSEGNPAIPTDSDRNDYRLGNKDCILYGRMTYRDIFGGSHWRTLCQPFHFFPPGLIRNYDHPKCTLYDDSDTREISLPKAIPVPEISSLLPEITCKSPD